MLLEYRFLHRLVLSAIVLVYICTGALYAIVTPKWQAPDEPAHFNYIRVIGDTGTLPVLQAGDYNQDYLEAIKAARFPPSMPVDAIRYESYQPPLYYLAATPAYLAARATGLDGQVTALRFFSVLLGVVVLLVAYQVVRELLPGDPVLALATAGLMATIPMHVAVTASVSNDTAAELVVAAILLLAVKRCKGTVTDRRYILIGGVLFGAGLLTKSTAYVTGASLLALAEVGSRISAVPMEGGAGVERLAARVSDSTRTLIPLFLIAFLISSPMFIRNMLTYGWTDPLGLARHDSIVVGQPRTVEMIRQYGLPQIVSDFFVITFRSFWAQFGWMGVLVDARIYFAVLALTLAALAGLVGCGSRVFRHRAVLTRTQWWCLACLMVLLVTGMADYVGYNFKFLQFQGRYLFPALVALAFFFVVGVREWSARKYTWLTFAVMYLALVGLDIACLFLYIVPQLRA